MKGLAVVVAFSLALVAGVVSVAQSSSAGTPHYPDLVTEPILGVRIVSDKATGRQLLKFPNEISNLGNGRFELRPVNNPGNGTTTAYQRVWTHDAGGDWTLHSEFPIGTFVFHPAHNHWHLEGFARYELRSVAPGGGIGRLLAASSPKVSFCMVDTWAINLGLEHAPQQRVYQSCGQSLTQGISVGWSDIYGSSLPGQNIDITNVQSGTYWLVSTADPDNHIVETNESNNSAAVQVTIRSSWKPKQ
jgi:Lysyl oxidase